MGWDPSWISSLIDVDMRGKGGEPGDSVNHVYLDPDLPSLKIVHEDPSRKTGG